MDHLTVEHGTRVSALRLSSLPANALSEPLIAELASALDDVAASATRVLVIASTLPRFFAAGADLKLIATLDRGGFAAYLERLRAVVEHVAALPQTSIATIDGIALGGGLELALACTLRVASPQARLGLPEIRLGLLPGAAGTQRLPRTIGTARALDLLLSGREVGGEEALAIGLVDRLADDANAAAAELAAGLASLEPDAVARVKAVAARALGEGPAPALELEAEGNAGWRGGTPGLRRPRSDRRGPHGGGSGPGR